MELDLQVLIKHGALKMMLLKLRLSLATYTYFGEITHQCFTHNALLKGEPPLSHFWVGDRSFVVHVLCEFMRLNTLYHFSILTLNAAAKFLILKKP